MNLLTLLTSSAVAPIIIGLGSAMHIEAAVEYLKANWKLPSQLAPYLALVLAIALNLGISFIFHVQLTETVVDTFMTTAAACFWHEFSSPSK